MSTLVLGQSLAGNWHLTVPNPEEAHWHTELAVFHVESTGEHSPAREAMELAAASAAVAFVATMPTARIRVQSHDDAARAAMTERVRALHPHALAA